MEQKLSTPVQMPERTALGRRIARTVAGLVALVLVVPAVAQAACPNQDLRERQGAGALPDCRAWEQVSPIDKNGYDVGEIPPYMAPERYPSYASRVGDDLFFTALGAFGDQPSSIGNIDLPYVARRGSQGWATQGLNGAPVESRGQQITLVDPDLTSFVMSSGERPALQAFGHAWLRGPNGDFDLISDQLGSGYVAAGNPDLTHMVVSPAAPSSAPLQEAYRDETGTLQRREIGVAPDGEPFPLPSSAATVGFPRSSVSVDGSRIAFRNPESANDNPAGSGGAAKESVIYVRDTGGSGPRTIPVTQPEPGVADPGPTTKAQFWDASPDLSKLLFTSHQRLTTDSTAPELEPDGMGGVSIPNDHYGELYLYDLENDDLRAISLDPSEGGSRVLGVAGISNDLSVVYFVAKGTLGTGQGVEGETNLFRWADGPGNGDVSHIATLTPLSLSVERAGERAAFTTYGLDRAASVSADGRSLTLSTLAQIAPEDTDANADIYAYDAAASGERWRCLSCSALGGPEGDAKLGPLVNRRYVSRFASVDGGRVFFETASRLVIGDVNARQDVYRYDRGTGAVELVSDGRSQYPAWFFAADDDGSNAFFATREPLVRQDEDQLSDLYVARVDGGIPMQNDARAATGCDGDECQGMPPRVPAGSEMGSLSLDGAGDLGEARRATLAIPRAAVARGAALRLRVRVSGPGSIRVRGSRVRAVTRVARGAATYRIPVVLTQKARRQLRRRGSLRSQVEVAFVPRTGARTARTATLTFKRPTSGGGKGRR